MKKILTIDNQKGSLTNIKALINNKMPECRVLIAQSEKEGIIIAGKEQPDTIVLNDFMPEADAYKVCKKLKGDKLTKHIPVIMITELTPDNESRIKGNNTGVDAFLSKPFDANELSAQIRLMLRIKEAEDKLRSEKKLLNKKVKKKTKELKESEKKFREIIENTPNIHYRQDFETGIIDYINPSVLTTLGYNVEEILRMNTKNQAKLFHPDDLPRLLAFRNKLVEADKLGKSFIELEFRMIDKAGKIHWFHGHYILTKGIDNKPKFVVGALTNISERYQADQIQLVLLNIAKAINTTKNIDELYHTIHQHLKTVIDVTNFYIALIEEDKNVISFPYFIDEKDTKPEPIPRKLSTGLTEYIIRTGRSLFATRNQFLKLARESKIKLSGSLPEVWIGIPLRIEKKIIGVMVLQNYNNASIYNENDLEVLELISYQISFAIKHKKTEQVNLRLSEIIRNCHDGIILTTPEGQINYINPALEKMSGYKLSELMNTDPGNLIITKEPIAITDEIRTAVKTSGEWKQELYCSRKNKEIYPIETRVFAINNTKGELVEIAAIQQDITERKKTEEALKNSQNVLKTILQNIPGGFLMIGEDYKIYQVNDRTCEISGFSEEELVGELCDIICPMGSASKECPIWAENFGGFNSIDTAVKCKDGHKNPVLKNAIIIMIDGKKYVLENFQDISKRKQSEKTLKESEERYRMVVESIMDGMIIIDSKGLIRTFNRSAEKMFGWSSEEILGQNLDRLMPKRFQAEHQNNVLSYFAFGKLNEAIERIIELPALRKTGEEFTIEVSLTPATISEKSFVLAVIRDITDRKQVEQALHQHTIQLQDRNEELDAFSHTVAHDLKNPLGTIIGFADLLLESYSELSKDEILEYLNIINKDGKKTQQIINSLLLFANIRKSEIRTEELNMGNIVAEAIKSLKPMIEKSNAEIIVPDIWPLAIGYTPWIEEVWVNYLSNAIKYSGTPPKVEIGFDKANTEKKQEGMHRFWVQDNGPGISAENQKLLFNKFERLDQVKTEGHGLGLSIVRRIIEKLGGQVGMDSSGGSLFYFTLPYVDKT